MIRMFEAHTVRRETELGGVWQMEALSDEEKTLGAYAAVVPSCWESLRGLENFRGHCRYRKRVTTRGGNLRLIFKGVSHTADVYWDGTHVAHHYNAYTPFDVVLPDVQAGEHLLEVVADNRFSEESTLHFANDYRSYGGITRPVVLEQVPDVFWRRLHVTPKREADGWKALIDAELQRVSGGAEELSAQIEIEGQRLCFDGLRFERDVCRLSGELTVPDVTAWSMETPALYPVKAVLFSHGEAIDDLIDRIGFREVRVEGGKILLNGRAVYIKGFNRHEDFASLGCAVPENAMNADLDIILSTGANLVRTSHYPNDERFLDLCDERGVLVWEEAHSRQIWVPRMKLPNFKRQTADCIDEMIESHFNHPCIILWGIMNEGESHNEEARPYYEAQFEQIKRLDPSRPTTTATNRHFKDLCYDLPDVISLNVYPLWYNKEEPVDYLKRIRAYLEEHGGRGKPVLISECGAGGVYGYRTFADVKWSEDRQAEILRQLLESYLAVEDLSGVILWQYSDTRVDEEYDFNNRPKCQNNKGIVDLYRQPKLGYYVVRELFHTRTNFRED